MLFPTPSFPLREFAAAVEEGYLCPGCRTGRLAEGEPSKLTCPSCGGTYTAGWRRHAYHASPPATLHGSPVENLGGFYETIQNYAIRPQLGLPSDSTENVAHVGDFVVDIDRDSLAQAQQDALKVHDFLDHVAPGQVRLYYSGSKGFHVTLPYQALGASPSPTLCSREYRQLAGIVHRATGVLPDYKIYSPARMLRRPDSWHPKTGRYKVEIEPDELHQCVELAASPRGQINTTPPQLSMDAHELYLDALSAVEDARAITDASPQFDFNPGGSGVPPCVSWMQANGLPGGTRHAVYLIMARFWKSSAVPLESFNSYGSPVQHGALVRGRTFAQDQKDSATPLSVRVRDMDACVRYVYSRAGAFRCGDVQAIGLCQDHCVVKQISNHPMAALLGVG